MRTIWKYALQVADLQTIAMPQGAQVLCVQTQSGIPQLWALVDPGAPMKERAFVTYGTGQEMPDCPDVYIGTYQIRGGALVFHVFEKRAA